MQTLSSHQLLHVVGGESVGQVLSAARVAAQAPLDQTYQTTVDFIRDHAFFHQGLMNVPIGGGKHFRNVPFIGPARIASGALHGDGQEIRKGIATTRGTWAAR